MTDFQKNADIGYMSVAELQEAYAQKRLTPLEVTQAILDRIAEINPSLNAFAVITAESALAEAKLAGEALARGEQRPLLGIPVTIKDAIDVQGQKSLQGSKWLASFAQPAAEDNPVVSRLRDAGAIILGKTTTSEMCWSGLSYNPLTGLTHNPWAKGMNAGASSAGAAVAAAAGFGPLHLGSDGGGSIRMPCHFCSVFGIKPTYGRVPHIPVSNNDYATHIGPITRTVEDSARMLSVLSGPHYLDHTSCEKPPEDYLAQLKSSMKGKKIAFSLDLGHARVDDDVAAVIRKAASAFAHELGAEVVEVAPAWGPKGVSLGRFFWAAKEARRNHILEEWEPEMGRDLVACMREGNDYSAVEFLNRRDEKFRYIAEIQTFMEQWDFLITPSASVTAFPPQQMVPSHWPQHIWDWMSWSEFMYPFNMSNNPAVTVPCGFTPAGLPVGLQIVGKRFDDLGVLQAAAAYEGIHPVYLQLPTFDSFK